LADSDGAALALMDDIAMINPFRRKLVFAATAFAAARPLLAGAQTPASAPAPSAPLKYPYAVPALGYGYDANEPAIDTLTMQLHHDKHHAAYVANLNKALADHPELQGLSLAQLLQIVETVPETIRATVRNNAGGHANHTMFWQVIGGKGGAPEGELSSAIDKTFGSFDKLKGDFNQAALKVFGSGWAMLLVDKEGGLSLVSRPNQDSPWMEGKAPLIGNDVWEHAYYLKYQNRRADYLAAWWSVVNWPAVATRYAAAKAGTLAI
jgi:Fe-Mn family superoxide dismutase